MFETYFSYWGYLLAVNLHIYLRTSSLKCETTSWNYQALHFWSVLLLKEHMVTSVRKMLKTLVWSAQSRLIPGEITLKITTKSAVFYRLLFGEVCPKNSAKITTKSADFSSNLSLKIPRNLTFSSATCQKPWQVSLLTGYIYTLPKVEIS